MTINKDKRLTKNFKLEEFVYSSYYNPSQQRKVLEALTPRHLHNFQKLADSLQALRDDLKQPVIIHLCLVINNLDIENQKQHEKGKGVLIFVREMNSGVLYNAIERLIEKGKMRQGKLSIVNNYVYYDIRSHKIRD